MHFTKSSANLLLKTESVNNILKVLQVLDIAFI